MPIGWGSQFRHRGPIYDPSERPYEWVAATKPGADWRPEILAVYEYWRCLAPPAPPEERRLPSRKSWEVLDVARFMPDIRFFEVHPWGEPPYWRYRCRLVGTNQAEALGFDPTGRWLDEAEPQTWSDPRFLARQREMITERVPTWRRGEIVFERSHDKGSLECLQMPFATDGVLVDMVADFTIYSFDDT